MLISLFVQQYKICTFNVVVLLSSSFPNSGGSPLGALVISHSIHILTCLLAYLRIFVNQQSCIIWFTGFSTDKCLLKSCASTVILLRMLLGITNSLFPLYKRYSNCLILRQPSSSLGPLRLRLPQYFCQFFDLTIRNLRHKYALFFTHI